ncbi:MAG: hypothetical protein A2Y61_05640 [Chloroflexi bacterium RBG_13_60_13]|nr:MAG: hypothetical protein A2Y61_05640 [Chloroflexi bacterium RBG_13_60_13]
MALTEGSPRNRTIQEASPKFPVTLAGTVIQGDILGYATGWKRALATVGTAIQGKLIALSGGVTGDVIEVCREAVISGFTLGTPGGLVYVEEGAGVGGGYTETAPTTQGDVNTIIGYVLAADAIYVAPSTRAGSVVA